MCTNPNPLLERSHLRNIPIVYVFSEHAEIGQIKLAANQRVVTLTISGRRDVVIGPHTRDVVGTGSSVLILVDLQRSARRLEQTLLGVPSVPELHLPARVPAARILFFFERDILVTKYIRGVSARYQGSVYKNSQLQHCDNSTMTVVMLFSLKTMESLENRLQTQSGDTQFFHWRQYC